MDTAFKEIIELLNSAARSLGAEVTSPWFYLQLGLVLAGAGVALAAGVGIRSRLDLTSLGVTRPAALRKFMRVMVGSASTAIFVALMVLARTIMVMSTWPSRSYLIPVAANLALAWLVIAPGDFGHSQPAYCALGVVVRVGGGGAKHRRSTFARDRRPRTSCPWCSVGCG